MTHQRCGHPCRLGALTAVVVAAVALLACGADEESSVAVGGGGAAAGGGSSSGSGGTAGGSSSGGPSGGGGGGGAGGTAPAYECPPALDPCPAFPGASWATATAAEVGLDSGATGSYALHWLDLSSGQVADETVTVTGGDTTFPLPPAIGSEVALRLVRQ